MKIDELISILQEYKNKKIEFVRFEELASGAKIYLSGISEIFDKETCLTLQFTKNPQ
jgi:hypothetical protein